MEAPEEGQSEEDYLKKLAANEAVKNLAELFSKMKKPETDQGTLKAKVQVDMSKFARPKKADYGLNLKQLRQWNLQHLKKLESEESALQEMIVAKVRGFMDLIGTLQHDDVYKDVMLQL